MIRRTTEAAHLLSTARMRRWRIAASAPRLGRAATNQRPTVNAGWNRAIELAQHILDWRDPCDGFARKSPTIGVGADHLPVDVDRTPAHAGDNPSDLEAWVSGLDQNQILLRQKAFQDIDHFDLETLWLGPFED